MCSEVCVCVCVCVCVLWTEKGLVKAFAHEEWHCLVSAALLTYAYRARKMYTNLCWAGIQSHDGCWNQFFRRGVIHLKPLICQWGPACYLCGLNVLPRCHGLGFLVKMTPVVICRFYPCVSCFTLHFQSLSFLPPFFHVHLLFRIPSVFLPVFPAICYLALYFLGFFFKHL